MLLGLTEPTEGAARVVGLDPSRGPLEVKRRVGYMPDSVGFYGDLTGRENLRYTARLNRMDRDEAETTIDEVLEQVGLTDRADDPVDTYSRGMLQRLGIADALVKDPDVLILDEPTTAIDPLGVDRDPRPAASASSASAGWRSCCRATCSTRSSRCATGSASSPPAG